MAKFDSILGTVGNTPVVRINRLAPSPLSVEGCHKIHGHCGGIAPATDDLLYELARTRRIRQIVNHNE